MESTTAELRDSAALRIAYTSQSVTEQGNLYFLWARSEPSRGRGDWVTSERLTHEDCLKKLMLLLQKWTKGIQDHVESCRKPAQETSACKYHGATGGRVPVGIAEVPSVCPTQRAIEHATLLRGHE